MGKHPIAAVAAILVLGGTAAVLWFTTASPAEPTPIARAAQPESRASGEPSADLVDVATPAPDEVSEEPASARVGAQVQPVEVAAESSEAAQRLRVVDPDGAPAAGARVWLFANASKEDLKAYGDWNEFDDWMAENAREHATDSEGVVRLEPVGEQPTIALASLGDGWAAKLLRDQPVEQEDYVLELARDVTLRARVVSTGGTPMPGIEVDLLSLGRWGRNAMRQEPTDETGLAVFRHAQRSFSYRDEEPQALGVAALVEEPAWHEFDREQPPAEVVTLVMPAFGSVLVRAFDQDGEPLKEGGRASLGIVREGEPRRISPFSEIRRHRVQEKIVDGQVRFPCVGLGVELEVRVYRGDANIATHVFSPGPQRFGEEAVVDVRLGSEHPVVRLRAIDENGSSVADTELGVRVTTGSEYYTNHRDLEVVTDAAGVFHVDLDRNWTEGTARALVVTKGPTDAPYLMGRVDAARELPPGVTDMGTVRLLRARLFVAGRVTGPNGEGIKTPLVLQQRSPNARDWRPVWNFQHSSDGDGRFEVREWTEGDRFRLAANITGWAGAAVEFEPGAQDLHLALDAEGAIEGMILLDPGIPLDKVELSLEGPVQHLDYRRRSADVDESGEFRFGSLRPGDHKVRLRIEGQGDSLAEVDGIAVVSGETTLDARLQPLDLRGQFHIHRLTIVTDPETTSIQGNVQFGPAGEERKGYRWFNEKEILLVTPESAVDVVINSRGYRSQLLESVQGDVEVELQRAIVVTIRLASHVELPELPLFMKVVLAPTDSEDFYASDWGAPAFDEQREIEVRVARPGEMNVRWILEQRSAGSSSSTMVNLDEQEVVDVIDAPGQSFEVTLTKEQLAKILSAFD